MKYISADDLVNIVKGVAHPKRMFALELIDQNPQIDLDEVAIRTKSGYKTCSFHLGKLYRSGLITKKFVDTRVEHTITKRGEAILTFLRKLE